LKAAWFRQRGYFCVEPMDRTDRLKRLRFRAWHRGTREADLLVGGFFDAHSKSWSEEDVERFETLLEEQDVDIMAWAFGTAEAPERYRGDMLRALRTVNYVKRPG
jgi:antitoxin CptB